MIPHGWIEGFKTRDGDVIGMVLCEIMIVSVVLGWMVFSLVFNGLMLLNAISCTLNKATAIFLAAAAGLSVPLIAGVITFSISVVQLVRTIGTKPSEGHDF